MDTYTGLLELESTLPSNALKIRLPAPKRITSTKEGHLKRQFRRERDLNNIFDVRFLFLIFGITYRDILGYWQRERKEK